MGPRGCARCHGVLESVQRGPERIYRGDVGFGPPRMTRDSPGRGNDVRKGEPEGRRCASSMGTEGLWPGGVSATQIILRVAGSLQGIQMLTAS